MITKQRFKMKQKSKLPTKNKFIQIRVNEEQYNLIKKVSKDQNKSVSELIIQYFESFQK